MAKSAGRHSSCAKQKRKKDMTDRSKQQPRPVLSNLLRLLAGGALLALSAQALAQYIWLDEKGIKHLSDRPPPPSVPDQRILKAPGKPLFDPYAPPPAADSDASSASASDAKPDARPKRRRSPSWPARKRSKRPPPPPTATRRATTSARSTRASA